MDERDQAVDAPAARQVAEKHKPVRDIATALTNIAFIAGASALSVVLAHASRTDEKDWLGSIIVSAIFIATPQPMVILIKSWKRRAIVNVSLGAVSIVVGLARFSQTPFDLIPIGLLTVGTSVPDLVIAAVLSVQKKLER